MLNYYNCFTEDVNPTTEETVMELFPPSNSTSTWAWDEADEIAFVLQEEHEREGGGDDGSPSHFKLGRNTSFKKLFVPTQRRYHPRHVPHRVYYPFALTAWYVKHLRCTEYHHPH